MKSYCMHGVSALQDQPAIEKFRVKNGLTWDAVFSHQSRGKMEQILKISLKKHMLTGDHLYWVYRRYIAGNFIHALERVQKGAT